MYAIDPYCALSETRLLQDIRLFPLFKKYEFNTHFYIRPLFTKMTDIENKVSVCLAQKKTYNIICKNDNFETFNDIAKQSIFQ